MKLEFSFSRVTGGPRFRKGVGLAVGIALAATMGAADARPVRKGTDFTLYSDERFHVSFPSIVRRPDGELLVAFRRAPERRRFGEKKTFHTDASSQLMLLRSRDDGVTWSRQPELLYAHPQGGSQDPCLLQLRDGTLLCSSYAWALLRPDAVAKLKAPVVKAFLEGYTFLGGYLLRSFDGGRSWSEPIEPPRVAAEITFDALGRPQAAFNRGAMYEGRDGRIFWVVAAHESLSPRRVSTHLLASADQGLTWSPLGKVAGDDKASFTETSIYETPKGDLVAFMRTEGLDDIACMARSTDGGKTFQPWQRMGFKGHPLQATRLPDDRVLLVYGYRHPPYGIRARVLDADCTDAATAPEIVLRDDGGTTDLGYPWSVVVSSQRALVVYYFNRHDGTRSIDGTWLELGP